MGYNSDSAEVAGGVGIPFSDMAKRYSKPHLILGVGAVAVLCAATGVREDELKGIIERNYPRGVEENLSYAKEVYAVASWLLGGKYSLKRLSRPAKPDLTGNKAIVLDATAAGLEIYAAYPMTPSSSILHYFASHGKRLGVVTIHPESELAVANIASVP